MNQTSGNEFARLALLIGEDKLELLSRARVAVLGLGGVGSFACEALARSGIGHFWLADFDNVSETNFNRQVQATRESLGRNKAEVMAERIRCINPSAKVYPWSGFMDAAAFTLLRQAHTRPGFCLDALDSFTPKVQVIKALLASGLPFISSLGAGGRLNPLAVRSGTLADVTTCTLAARLKRVLRKASLDLSAVAVVYSTETAVKPQPRTEWEEGEWARGRVRGKQGSACFVPAVFGMTMAYRAVMYLANLDAAAKG